MWDDEDHPDSEEERSAAAHAKLGNEQPQVSGEPEEYFNHQWRVGIGTMMYQGFDWGAA